MANVLSIRALLSKRKFGAESKKVVDKHSRSLLKMCILEFLVHCVVILFDVSFYGIKRLKTLILGNSLLQCYVRK